MTTLALAYLCIFLCLVVVALEMVRIRNARQVWARLQRRRKGD
jgi:hypothetical protein